MLTWRRSLQVSSRTASAAAQSAAARLGRGKAALALELVGYDEDLSAAMKYAFGSAFVCKVSQLPSSDQLSAGGCCESLLLINSLSPQPI